MGKSKNQIFVSIGLIIIGMLVGLIMASDLGVISILKAVQYQEESNNSVAPVITGRSDQAFIAASKKATKTVVNISTTRTVPAPQYNSPFLEDPFFKKFFGEEFFNQKNQQSQKADSLGSGVIVDSAGYIITNFHVIDGADVIKVYLYDKREFVATVVGSDKKIDLAVLKIEADDLPAAKWSDSDKLQIGEYVLAVGNPFGLNQTVTMGIVSAVGRSNVGISDYENFIQTDAAINPGNSGGALVNIDGDLVGMNTAIYTRSGGYMGIGFAVPSNMIKAAMDSLIKYGKVIRGWLGVSIQGITEELARQFALPDLSGALVSEVISGSPADLGGLERGDVIVAIGKSGITDVTRLRNLVAGLSVGVSVVVEVIRDGKVKQLNVSIGDLGEAEKEMVTASKIERKDVVNALNGLSVQEISIEVREKLNLSDEDKGVIVSHVDSESFAADAGLAPLDIIQEINRQSVEDLDSYYKAVTSAKDSKTLLLLIKRKGRNLFVTVKNNS